MAPPAGGSGNLAVALHAGIERIVQDAARQLRRALPHRALVIALAGDDEGSLAPWVVVHCTGFEEPAAALTEHMLPAWREAATTGRVVRRTVGDTLELTAPLLAAIGRGDARHGAMTLLTNELGAPQGLAGAESTLAAVATATAAALDRAAHCRRADEARQLERAGTVAAGIAHALRNPLFGISAAAQLLRFRAVEDPVIERNVGRVLREVERLNALVSDLLEFGDPRPVEPHPGDPDALWDAVLERGRGLLESRALALVRTRAAPGVRCAIDHDRLARAFHIALACAAESAPEGSTLTLHAAADADGAWRSTLLHEGAPIAPEQLPRFFELFASERPLGSGVELALCRRIVLEHGGTVAIENAPKGGAALSLALPPLPTTPGGRRA